MPEEHESRCHDVEAMQGPDRASRQLKDIDAVHRVADIGQHQVSPAVRVELPGAGRLDQHWQRADGEQHGRDRSREYRQVCHVDDVMKDRPKVASGPLPILLKHAMGEFPHASSRELTERRVSDTLTHSASIGWTPQHLQSPSKWREVEGAMPANRIQRVRRGRWPDRSLAVGAKASANRVSRSASAATSLGGQSTNSFARRAAR
jgi:hypothetical protein